MMQASIIRFLSALCFVATASHALSLTKPGCQEKCGNIIIPYPFGIGAKCSANSSFTVICQNSAMPPRPLLSSINMEILNISLYGAVLVNLPLWPTSCFDGMITESLPISLKGGPFFISSHYNSLVVMGCKNSVWLRTNATTVGGCMAICDASTKDITCNGVNCCRISIPTRLQELQYTYQSIRATSGSLCGYVFPADKKWLQSKGYKRYKGLVNELSNPFDRDFGFAPLVLEWELGTGTNFSKTICHYPHDVRLRRAYQYDYSGDVIYRARYPDVFCSDNPEDYRCQLLLDNYAKEYRYTFYHSVHDYVSSTRYCSCISGFEGNPYILKGCSDIDECRNARLNDCSDYSSTCINTEGSFICGYDYNQHYLFFTIAAFIIIVGVVGVLIWLNKVWFMKENGGIMLEKTMQFSPEEVAKATDGYNESRVLGSGGEGVVYLGILEDGRNVAVKKLERRLNQKGDHVQDFIKEVINMSKINHRNVVKLLGYCLEDGALHLFYEYMSNGTLSSHIHTTGDEVPHLSWDIRVRIAQQAGGALAYLHSAASVSIYHRDIKSTNILLDEQYCAKISDFGISRSISPNDTHVTTRVIGTHGYLDPEYFQSNRLTDKSDVYSFGVVLVELLTGEKAISDVRGEERRNLAMHFLHSMEEDRLYDILDARVLGEGRKEEIEAMAEIARKCLHQSGKDRPTMNVVACQLQGIQAEENRVPPKKKKRGFGKQWPKLNRLISIL